MILVEDTADFNPKIPTHVMPVLKKNDIVFWLYYRFYTLRSLPEGLQGAFTA
jgi:hypothetical protein